MFLQNSSKNIIITMLFFLAIIANIPIDIHVPSLPVIVSQLKITLSEVHMTMSFFLLSYSFSPLIYGLLSEKYSIKSLINFGLIFMIIGSWVCTISTTFSQLLIGRFIQGIGAAGCSCLFRVIIRHNYHSEEMSKIASLLSIPIELTLVFSPVIGGYLVYFFGWHSNFLIVAFLAFALLFFISYFYIERKRYHYQKRLNINKIAFLGKKIFSNRVFIKYILGSSAAYCSGIAFFTISPFVVHKILNSDPGVYGLVSIFVTVSLVLGAVTNAYLIKIVGCERLSIIGLAILLLSGSYLVIFSLLGQINILNFILPSSTASWGMAFLFGNCMSGALEDYSELSGIASSLYSFIQAISAFFITSIISFFSGESALFLGFIYITTSSIALFKFKLPTPSI